MTIHATAYDVNRQPLGVTEIGEDGKLSPPLTIPADGYLVWTTHTDTTFHYPPKPGLVESVDLS